MWVPAVGLLASEPAAHAPSGTAGFYVSFSRWRPGWVAVLCLAAVVVPLSDGVSPSWAQPEEGDLRVIPLAETDAEYEGRLEIYHEGEWGGICDDYWGIQNARVACRELGFGSVSRCMSFFIRVRPALLSRPGAGGARAVPRPLA